jgi:hypothetical protein
MLSSVNVTITIDVPLPFDIQFPHRAQSYHVREVTGSGRECTQVKVARPHYPTELEGYEALKNEVLDWVERTKEAKEAESARTDAYLKCNLYQTTYPEVYIEVGYAI